jgi:serine protease inhibitor
MTRIRSTVGVVPTRTVLTTTVLAATAVLAAGVMVAGCGSRPAPRVPAPGEVRGIAAVEPGVSAKPYAAADVAFGLAVLGAMCRQSPAANVLLSPSSLASALGMAYLGARGQTATQMAAVMHLPAGGSLEAGLQARSKAIAALDGPGVTVAEADKVWADPAIGLPYRSYLNAVATGYGAGLGRVPLSADPARAAREIDAAIAAATKGHIARLLSAQDLSGADFVLTDALYLDARWAAPFHTSQITTGQFTAADGTQAQVRYLNGQDVASATADGWSAVSLPYRGSRLTMTALLPPAISAAPGESCPTPSTAVLSALSRSLHSPQNPVDALMKLPEVSLRSQEDLGEPGGLLASLGMSDAFDGGADFTGMSPKPVQIGPVIQAATLRVGPGGTVGSAATAAVMVPTSLEVNPPSINFNRPYLLLVSSASTGEPLFLARVANPEQS